VGTLCVLLISTPLVAQAQTPAAQRRVDPPPSTASPETAFLSYRLDEWTVDDGLPGHVARLIQTPDGYLWVATWSGLARFDGRRFTVYTAANTPAFLHSAFTRMYVTHAGELWVGAQDGMIYQRKEGGFIPHAVLHAESEWINAFAEDAEGRLWVTTNKGTVAFYDGETWTKHPQRLRGVFPPFVADARGRIWTYLPGTTPQPPVFRHFSNGIPARLDSVGFLPQPSTETLGFVQTQYGPLFHRPAGSLASYHREGRIRMDLLDAQGALLGWYWHTSKTAFCLLIDRQGRVWIQLDGPGDEGTLHVYKEGVLLAEIKPEGGTGWIDFLLEDAEGNIWFKARGSGLFRAQLTPFTRYPIDDGVLRNATSAFESPDGKVLVSSNSVGLRGTVTLFQGATWLNRQYRLRSSGSNHAPADTVALGNVVVDAQGQWWGLSQKHLLRLNDTTAEPVWHSDDGNIFIQYVDPARPGYLWLGTSAGALYGFDTSTLEIKEAYQVGTSTIISLFRDSRGRLWAGLEDQLARLEQDSTLTVFDDDAVSKVSISAFYEDAEGVLWIGTHDKGLVRYQDGHLRSLRTGEGLTENTITSILEDADGYFWLSGNLGIQRIRRADLKDVLDGRAERVYAVNLPMKAGYLRLDTRLQSALKDRTGALWYPSLRGITRIDPALYQAGFAQPPAVMVEEILTENQAFSADAPLSLPRGERRLTITYSAISMRAPDLLQFRYRLEGVNGTWIDAGNQRSAPYMNLKPGTYAFRVQALNAGGIWSEADAVFTFRVPPFFYETTWFYLLCVLGILGLGAAIFSYRLRFYKRKQRALDHLVKARTHELAVEKKHVEQALEIVAEQSEQLKSLDRAKSRFFANISHEFRTPLLLILGPLEDLKEGLHGDVNEEAQAQVELAARNSQRLLHLVNQLLDVSRLETGRLTLQAQPVDAVAFVSQIAHRFDAMAKRRRIDFHLALPDEPRYAYIDPDQFEKVLVNLLGNAFKFSPVESSVTLSVTTQDDPQGDGHLVVALQDTGPGIAAAHLPHLFERFYQVDASSMRRQPGTGIGLALVKELITLHHGTIDVTSKEGIGSTFTVRLPLGRAHLSDEELAPPSAPAGAVVPEIASYDAPEATVQADDAVMPLVDASGDGATLETTLHGADDVTTVLVVDDNADVRAYMRRHLAKKYRVEEAANGRAALEAARRLLPDLIVSDVMMPEMDGYAFCKALKDDPEFDFIPVILLTAKASPESKITGLEGGADDYLTKPFNVRELEARVDNLIASRRRLKARFNREAAFSSTLVPVPDHPTLPPDDQHFLEQIHELLEMHLSDENLSVAVLAEAMGLSRATLYRRVKEVFGQSPMALIWEIRLQHAAVWLTRPDVSVSEVAYGVGFRSIAHFSTRFSERFGISPSAFRAGAALKT